MTSISTCREDDIAHYSCRRVRRAPVIDGVRDDPVWLKAERSPRFVDMVTGEPGFFDTRAAVVWDDEALYAAFWVEEPFVRASLTERDSLIFQENDVESSSIAATAITSSRSTHAELGTKFSSCGRIRMANERASMFRSSIW